MRTIITFLILMIGSNIFGQNDSIEKAVLFKKASSSDISVSQYSRIVKDWNITLKNVKGYPKVPINNVGKIQYSFLKDFPDLSKRFLYNRILEWFSITYGIVPANLYSNPEDGKIICSNSLKISDNTTSSFTYVISIKDKKILLDIVNLGYMETQAGHYTNDTWIPDTSNFYGIDQVFPIILKDSAKWEYYLNIVITIHKQINNDIDSLSDYIINFDLRYNF